MATINMVGTGLSQASGTGKFAGTTSPTFVTPVLGAATATSINFGGSTLNNYTSATAWTPVFTFATPGDVSVSYAVQQGFYSRIGNIVVASFYLLCTPTYTTASGGVQISGLPAALNGSISIMFGPLSTNGVLFPTGITSLYCSLATSQTLLLIGGSGSGVAAANFSVTQCPTATQVRFQGNITYQV